jgi:eukaryotic-like serine/threonine-protein kinase
MTPDRFRQISELYHSARARDPEQRSDFLEQSCGRDQDLRHEVESLLASEKSAEAFFSSRGETKRSDKSPSLVGRILDNYKVLSLLGAGGMGEVYLARDARLGREVAIKVLPAGFASLSDRQRLDREARAASALNHPNILTIYEIKEVDENLFIVAEFVDGQTLRQRLKKDRLKRAEALDVAIQVASALSAAHAAGIVHRDIKPENIMLRRDALVKVLDFGLAKLTDDPQTTTTGPEEVTLQWLTTEPGIVLGTTAYMSPEQARGLEIDARSDIWSMGVVLYEMISGCLPFAGATKSDVIASILQSEPHPLEDDAREPAVELKWILHKALRKEKEERYQTAREFLGDLKDLKQDLDTQSKVSRSFRAEPSGSAKRFQPGILIAVLLGVIVLAGLAFASYKYFARSRPRPALPAANVIPFTTFSGRELQPTFSPDGNQIAFAWNGEKRDNFDIYVKLVNTGTPPLRLTTNPADDLFPAWSPDGRQIAFVRQTGSEINIIVVPALGGPERKLYSGTSAFLSLYEYGNALSWSPDGKYLAFSGQRSPREPNSIYLLSLDNLETRQLTQPPAGFLGDSTPAFSPDGKVLAFVRGASSRDVEIYVMPATGGDPKRLTFDNRSGRSLAWTADGHDIVFSLWFYGNLRLWRVPASGGTPEQLAVGGEGGSTLAISRPGDRLAYSQESRDTDIWRVEITGSGGTRNPTRLISSTRPDYGPQYSPDAKRIAFTSGRSGNNEIWVCDADGQNPVQLTSFGGPDVGSPRWSPDGRQIAFDSVAAGNRDIFVVGAEEGKSRRLTEDSSDEVRPSWSRDGAWIYFGSNRTGDWQIWKAPAQGGKAIQVTQQGGREAFESVDGKYVYYSRGFGIAGIWKVPVAGGEEVRVLDNAFQGFWALLDKGIYFVNLNATLYPTLDFFDFATNRTRRVAVIEKQLQLVSPSLAVSPDGRWILHAKVDRFESDIMLVENFH